MNIKKCIYQFFGLIFLIVLNPNLSFGQLDKVDVGLRFQKTIDLYYENGITIQYNYSKKISFGASYITSRLGSAIGSNAIKQDNFIISGAYLFRPNKNLKPFMRLNTGYFTADYESPLFDNLQNNSAILSVDGGLSYSFKCPLKLNASIGYNAITGDGAQGAGTLYPVFFQTSVFWNLKKAKQK
jgi:hypothetical protein